MKPVQFTEDEFQKFHLFDVKAEVYQFAGEVKPAYGELVIDFSLTGYRSETRRLRLPLMGVWTCNTKPTVETVCKAHVSLPNWKQVLKKNPTPELELLQRLVAWIHKKRGVKHHKRPTMRLSVDDRLTVLRYGAEDPAIPFPAPLPGENNWDTVPIFDTKSLALQEIFRVISKFSKTIISGTDLIDLNKVSDTVLQEIGFIKVPDRLGRGVPMWQGDPERIATLGKSSFRTGYSRYRSYRDERNEASAATQEVINSFLDILEAELSV